MKKVKRALIISDMQNSFLPNGSLPVQDSDKIVEGINRIQNKFDTVIATKDWHPQGHKSFASSHPGKNAFESIELNDGSPQILWPDHCEQDTAGAEFVANLETKKFTATVYKGLDLEIDSYSGFFDNMRSFKTELDDILNEHGITDIYITGVALDVCVKYTALDGVFLNYKVFVIEDLTKPVTEEGKKQALYEFGLNGIKVIQSSQIN